MQNYTKYSGQQYMAAWGVHLFTASAGFLGVISLVKIYQHNFIQAFWFMALTIIIDATDGTLARLVNVKHVLPRIDGTLLDNLVDYLNYVITPAFFLWVHPTLLPDSMALWIIIAITLTSAYQFCQIDAKTPDHFFKGFPCYWNIAIFYLFILDTSSHTSVLILSTLCVLIFIPVKYVYPSRLDHLTHSKILKILMHACSVSWGMSSALLLFYYPEQNPYLLVISLGYVGLYALLSLYRTFIPLENSEKSVLLEENL